MTRQARQRHRRPHLQRRRHEPQAGAGAARRGGGRRITEYLKATDRYAKTIVFCEDIDHAARMRQALSNANADICATQPNYVVQITGDNPEGKRELDNFIDPEKTYPVIATTSKLMSTGVDARPASSSCWTRTSSR
jgi:type I site-specific restriction endonuclease